MNMSRQLFFGLKIILFWMIGGNLFNRYSYIGGIILTIVAMFFYFTLKDEEKFIFILSSVPMAAIFKISADLPSSIILFYFMFILEYFYEKRKINKRVLLGLLTLFFAQIIAILIYQAALISIISFIINILFCEVAFEKLSSVQDKLKVLKKAGMIFGLVMILNIGLAMIYPNMAYVISYEKQKALETAGRFAALNADSNYYNQLVSVAISLLLAICLMKTTKKFQKIYLAVIIIFLIIKGMESKSKSFVIVLFVIIILLVFLMIRNTKINKIFILKIFVIAMLGVLLSIYFFNEVLVPLFIERSLDNTTLLSNREVIWKNYFYGFVHNPSVLLVGTGIMNGGNILSNGSAAHNVYLEILAETGIVGCISIYLILKPIFKKFKLLFKSTNLIFVWALLITSFGLSLSSNDAMFVLLPLVALVGGGNNSDKEYIKKD